MIRLIIFSLFISYFLLDLILFKGDFCKICGLGFGSICKFKLGVNKDFSWSLLNTIVAMYIQCLHFKNNGQILNRNKSFYILFFLLLIKFTFENSIYLLYYIIFKNPSFLKIKKPFSKCQRA